MEEGEGEEEVDAVEVEERRDSSLPLCEGLVTLSTLPKSRWHNLTSLDVIKVHPLSHPHTLTSSLCHPLTPSHLTPSRLTPSLFSPSPHILTPSHPHNLTPSLHHPLTPSLLYLLTLLLPHLLTSSLLHSFTPSHPHPLTPSRPHSLTPSQERNKPKEPPKPPAQAPFFLPTLPGLEPKFLPAKDNTTGRAT